MPILLLQLRHRWQMHKMGDKPTKQKLLGVLKLRRGGVRELQERLLPESQQQLHLLVPTLNIP
jgi:hypothetical protein